ncbi:unnamed protein product [Linum trigynum]|uniref:Uncharacterized protein n=1 Tax=Linum trigynum TaxID=586398 RepID=A0AAV2FM22_9ROSI
MLKSARQQQGRTGDSDLVWKEKRRNDDGESAVNSPSAIEEQLRRSSNMLWREFLLVFLFGGRKEVGNFSRSDDEKITVNPVVKPCPNCVWAFWAKENVDSVALPSPNCLYQAHIDAYP